jgi:hypothetical protein
MLNMCKLYKRDLLIRIQLFVPKWHLKKLASYTYFCNFHDICKGLPSRRLSQLMQLWNYQERTELLNRILPRLLNLRKYIFILIPSSKKMNEISVVSTSLFTCCCFLQFRDSVNFHVDGKMFKMPFDI